MFLPSQVVKRNAEKLHIPPEKVRPLANAIAHLEHGGGAVVGVEFIAPHFFGPFALASIAISVIILRIAAGLEA